MMSKGVSHHIDGVCRLNQVGEKKQRVHVGFMDLEKAYDRVNRRVLYSRF